MEKEKMTSRDTTIQVQEQEQGRDSIKSRYVVRAIRSILKGSFFEASFERDTGVYEADSKRYTTEPGQEINEILGKIEIFARERGIDYNYQIVLTLRKS